MSAKIKKKQQSFETGTHHFIEICDRQPHATWTISYYQQHMGQSIRMK